MLRLLKDNDIKFMAIRRVPIILSAILIVVSLSSIIIKGFNYGIDFSSGYIVQLKFQNEISVSKIESRFSSNNINDLSIQLYGSNKDILIKLKDEEIFQKKNINNYLNEIFSDMTFSISSWSMLEHKLEVNLEKKVSGPC